jgi:branched-chain amino acid transport system substrate-binding protein
MFGMGKTAQPLRWKHRITGILGCIGLLAAASACGSSSGGSGASQATTVKIGGICDLSGDLATFGQFCRQSLELAVHVVNQAGGISVGGHKDKIALTVVDGRSDPTASVAAARNFVSEGYKVIFGPDTDVTSSQVLQATANTGVMEFAGGSSDQAIIGTSGHTLQFSVLQPNSQWQSAVLPLLKKMGISSGTVAIVYPSDVGQTIAPQFAQILSAAGYTPKQFLYPPTTTDYRTVLSRVKATKPAVVLQGYSVQQGLPLTTTALQLGVANAVIGVGETPAQVPEAIAKSQGKSFPLVWGSMIAERSMDPTTTPQFGKFVRLWQGYFHLSPNLAESQTVIWFYDPVGMLVKAMEKAGTVTNTTAIAKALHSWTPANPYQGALTDWYNSRNVIIRGSDIAVFRDGTAQWTYLPPPTS